MTSPNENEFSENVARDAFGARSQQPKGARRRNNPYQLGTALDDSDHSSTNTPKQSLAKAPIIASDALVGALSGIPLVGIDDRSSPANAVLQAPTVDDSDHTSSASMSHGGDEYTGDPRGGILGAVQQPSQRSPGQCFDPLAPPQYLGSITGKAAPKPKSRMYGEDPDLMQDQLKRSGLIAAGAKKEYPSIPFTLDELHRKLALAQETQGGGGEGGAVDVMMGPGFTFSVYSPDSTHHYSIESENICITKGSLKYVEHYAKFGPQTRYRFQLCNNYVQGKCPKLSECQYIHGRELPEPSTVHLNVWVPGSQEEFSPAAIVAAHQLETLVPGFTLHVYRPNAAANRHDEVQQPIPSHMILKTVGAETAARAQQQQQIHTVLNPSPKGAGGAAPRCKHCAHFQFKRLCNLGYACHFVHAKTLCADRESGNQGQQRTLPNLSSNRLGIDPTAALGASNNFSGFGNLSGLGGLGQGGNLQQQHQIQLLAAAMQQQQAQQQLQLLQQQQQVLSMMYGGGSTANLQQQQQMAQLMSSGFNQGIPQNQQQALFGGQEWIGMTAQQQPQISIPAMTNQQQIFNDRTSANAGGRGGYAYAQVPTQDSMQQLAAQQAMQQQLVLLAQQQQMMQQNSPPQQQQPYGLSLGWPTEGTDYTSLFQQSLQGRKF